jgi:hypothetical protein
MHINPNNLYEKLVEAGEAWAEANAAAELWEETKKTLVSNLMAQSNEKSSTARESWAYRQDDYENHVQHMIDARREANRLKVRYDSAKIYTELLRTQAATERLANRESM